MEGLVRLYMAIIKCPECGHQVSDMAPTCPGCGVEIAGKVVKCPDCGEIYFRNQMVCPACHRPTTSTPTQRPVPVRHTEPITPVVKPKPEPEPDTEKKSYTKIIVGLVIALVLCGGVAYYYNDLGRQEKSDYALASQSNDPLVIEEYLNKYKDTNPEHRESLQARLAVIQQIDKEWTDVLITGSRDQIEQYAKTHPDSPHKAEAMNKVDSMDYAHVMKDKTIDAFINYVKQHPNGRFVNDANAAIDAIKMTQLQPEETKMVKALFKKFFQSVNSRNEGGMLSTVADQLTNFLGQSGAGKADVATFLKKLYKSDITNMNWHIIDDYKIDKKAGTKGAADYTVQFTAEQNISRADATQPTYCRYQISATVSSDGKISGLNMKRLTQQ
jgi:uncharacterized OB-fold protein